MQSIRLDSPDFAGCKFVVFTWEKERGCFHTYLITSFDRKEMVKQGNWLRQFGWGSKSRDQISGIIATIDEDFRVHVLDDVYHRQYRTTQCEIVSMEAAQAAAFPNWLCQYIERQIKVGVSVFTSKPGQTICATVVTPVPQATPAQVRLSKKDWLRQHYPDMQELPKWRFPAMATD